MSRRRVLTTAAALAVAPRSAFSARAQSERQIPFLNDDQPQDMRNQVVWPKLRDWHTPATLETVQLKIDDGEWLDVTLETPPADATRHTWTFWSYRWSGAAAGRQTLVSRAIDVKGRVQPRAEDPEIALKKTYWEANEQIVREIEL